MAAGVDYSKDPEFQKAVAAGVAAELTNREKAGRKGQPWKNTDEAEERIADRVVEKMLAALSEDDDDDTGKGGGGLSFLGSLFGAEPGKREAS